MASENFPSLIELKAIPMELSMMLPSIRGPAHHADFTMMRKNAVKISRKPIKVIFFCIFFVWIIFGIPINCPRRGVRAWGGRGILFAGKSGNQARWLPRLYPVQIHQSNERHFLHRWNKRLVRDEAPHQMSY